LPKLTAGPQGVQIPLEAILFFFSMSRPALESTQHRIQLIKGSFSQVKWEGLKSDSHSYLVPRYQRGSFNTAPSIRLRCVDREDCSRYEVRRHWAEQNEDRKASPWSLGGPERKRQCQLFWCVVKIDEDDEEIYIYRYIYIHYTRIW